MECILSCRMIRIFNDKCGDKWFLKGCKFSFVLLGILVFICLFCFVALLPKSTAMVFAGRSVHLTTLFPGQA